MESEVGGSGDVGDKVGSDVAVRILATTLLKSDKKARRMKPDMLYIYAISSDALRLKTLINLLLVIDSGYLWGISLVSVVIISD